MLLFSESFRRVFVWPSEKRKSGASDGEEHERKKTVLSDPSSPYWPRWGDKRSLKTVKSNRTNVSINLKHVYLAVCQNQPFRTIVVENVHFL